MLGLYKRTLSLIIGCASNVVAGVMVSSMLIVQLAINAGIKNLTVDPAAGVTEGSIDALWRGLTLVHLGLDIVWDAYLCLGTLLVAWNMRHHPRFGWIFAAPGMAIASALMVLNIHTFPTPPGEAGLVDLGPVVGLWYLVVAIHVLRSLRWVDEQLEAPIGD
jgi:hypothetical protein